MKTFSQYYNNSPTEAVAVFPGSFKPPHKGHFRAFVDLLEEADRGIVYIGRGIRDGIDQKASYRIWQIYKAYIQKPVEVIKCESTPVKPTYDFVVQNPEKKIFVGAGDKEKDTRFNSFEKNKEKYPNVVIKRLSMKESGFSGTEARQRIVENQPDAVNYFVPTEIKATDRELIKRILNID